MKALLSGRATAPGDPTRLEVAHVDKTEALHGLREEWVRLCARTREPHFFHGPDWAWHAWRDVAQGLGRKLCVITGRLDGRLVLVWPMMIDRRTLRMLSSDTLEYRDIVVEDDPRSMDWMRQAWQAVRRLRGVDVFLLQNLRAPSNLDRLMRTLPGALPVGGGWCPVIRLGAHADWDAYSRHLPRSMLNDQRRQWRRAREVLPDLGFEVLSGRERIAPMLDWILAHKVRWLEERGKNAAHFAGVPMRTLFEQVLGAAAGRGELVLARLGGANATVSAGFGYRFGRRFLFHVFVYDAAHARLSPSRLFLEGLVRWCLDNGVDEFDFMPGDEAYKAVWADDVVRTDSWAGALTPWGRVLLLKIARPDLLRDVAAPLRGVYARMPARLRRVLRERLRALGVSEVELRPRPAPPVAPNPSAGVEP